MEKPCFRFKRSYQTQGRYGRDLVVPVTTHHRRRRLVISLVILLLVPAGILALVSLRVPESPQEMVAESQPYTVSSGGSSVGSAAFRRSPDPFLGTPAARFSVGSGGIVLPTATPVGEWGPEEITRVLQKTKAALAAARLDSKVLLAQDTSAYLAMLSPSTRDAVKAEIAKGAPALGYVTRLAPGWRLVAPVRVGGRLSVALGAEKQLLVTADYLWAYALRGPWAPVADGPGSRVVVLHTVETYQWYPEKGYAEADRGLRPGTGSQALSNMDCDLAQEGLLALPRSRARGEQAHASRIYDLAVAPDQAPTTC
jgi:hypothetical protein